MLICRYVACVNQTKTIHNGEGNGDATKALSKLIRFQTERSCFAPGTAIVHTTTPKTITENGAVGKRSPEWSDLKTLFSSVDGENDAI